MEFYSLADLEDPEIADRLSKSRFYYNWQGPHGSLNSKTPMQVAADLGEVTPLREEVGQRHGPNKERIQSQNYQVDLAMKTSKESP
ncbi:MAG: hypothetical protein RJQ07_02780 [Pseudomonadales bacterium]